MTKLRMIVLASSNRLAYAARNGKLMMVVLPCTGAADCPGSPAPPQPRLLDRVRPLSAEPLAR